jgi:hypothetical protein
VRTSNAESKNKLLHCGLLDHATAESGSSFLKDTLFSSKGWGHMGRMIMRKCDNHLPDYAVCDFYDAGNSKASNIRMDDLERIWKESVMI